MHTAHMDKVAELPETGLDYLLLKDENSIRKDKREFNGQNSFTACVVERYNVTTLRHA